MKKKNKDGKKKKKKPGRHNFQRGGFERILNSILKKAKKQ